VQSTRSQVVGARLGLGFTAGLAPAVRANMMTELWGSVAYGIFWAAALQFVPVVLRRMGAGPELLALYSSQTYIGFILTSLSVVLMRGRRTKNFAVWCWMTARATFLIFAFVSQVYWLMAVMAVFWILEAFPSPAYTRIIQVIYPQEVRGKVMSVVRLGMTGAIILTTPFAGWMLDHWGYRVLFPLAALAGILATWFFNRLDVDEGTLPPRQTHSIMALWAMVLRNRNFVVHLASFTLFGIGALVGIAFYPIVQVDRLHLSYTTIGLLGTAQSITWMLGFVFWGRVVDSRGGIFVMRINLLIGALVPFAYIFADNAWMLLPAFIAQGVISAGIDLGLLSTCIHLAEEDKVVEYAAVQSTVIGIRGLIAPFIGVWLVHLGMTETAIFAIGTLLTLLAFVVALQIRTPLTPEQMRARRERLRFRFPLRFKFPRI
jgi:MFS family permease